MATQELDRMLDNLHADSWSDTTESEEWEFEDPRASPLARLESYVDYCFETYPIVYNVLDRDKVTTHVADWGRRRGQHWSNKTFDQRTFGKRVDSSHREYKEGNHAILLAEALIGVPPKNDNGSGWKACVRHELGHAIDYEKRGSSDHGPEFKSVMAQFGEAHNDGASTHGYPPRYHRNR